jgi:hypothetical protein
MKKAHRFLKIGAPEEQKGRVETGLSSFASHQCQYIRGQGESEYCSQTARERLTER